MTRQLALTAALAVAGYAQQLAETTRDGRIAPVLKNLGKLHVPVTTASADA